MQHGMMILAVKRGVGATNPWTYHVDQHAESVQVRRDAGQSDYSSLCLVPTDRFGNDP